MASMNRRLASRRRFLASCARLLVAAFTASSWIGRDRPRGSTWPSANSGSAAASFLAQLDVLLAELEALDAALQLAQQAHRLGRLGGELEVLRGCVGRRGLQRHGTVRPGPADRAGILLMLVLPLS